MPSALTGATAAGDLAIATGEGGLVLAPVRAEPGRDDGAGIRTPHALAAAFLDSTTEVPGNGDWEPEDLQAVTTATRQDPAWLRRRR